MTPIDFNLAISNLIANPGGAFGDGFGEGFKVELYTRQVTPEELDLNLVYLVFLVVVFLVVSHNQHSSKNQAKAIN